MEELKEVTVPYVVHEGEMTRMERTNHRLWMLCRCSAVTLQRICRRQRNRKQRIC